MAEFTQTNFLSAVIFIGQGKCAGMMAQNGFLLQGSGQIEFFLVISCCSDYIANRISCCAKTVIMATNLKVYWLFLNLLFNCL